MKHLSLALALSVLSSVAFAQEYRDRLTMQREQTPGVLPGSDEYFRIGKNFGGTVQLGGMGPTTMSNTGISLQKYLDRNRVILFEGMIGRMSSDTGAKNFPENKWESKSIGVHYKQFFGNTFYLRGGVDQSWVKVANSNVKTASTLTGNDWKANYFELEGDVTSAAVSLGNQWQWETLTIGCDWVGLSRHLRHTITKDYVNDRTGTNADTQIESANSAKSLFLTGSGLHLLRFYVGATF